MREYYDEILLLEEEDYPVLIESECAKLMPVITDFVDTWAENKEKPAEAWLPAKLQEHLPEKTTEEITTITDEIIVSIKRSEDAQASLEAAVADGRSKESWFADQAQKATSALSGQEASTYLATLDSALKEANESLYRTITTQAGKINQNPNLDGFIAEQYHAQTFNLEAVAKGSKYRAKVLEPDGHGYAKNSVDIVIADDFGNGKIIKRYQCKYCKDAKATAAAFERGDYRGQQRVVPEGQKADIPLKTTTKIESPDGIKSTPLTKADAQRLRDEAQSGKWNDLNWNEYKAKDLASGIGRQAGYAAIQGAAIGVGLDVAQKLWNGETIKAKNEVEIALKGSADFGLKAAAAGALKVGVEKNIITVIPKGTPAGTIANIVHVAVEDAKVIGKMASGEYDLREGLDKLEQTTVSTVGGLITAGKGAATGAALGAIAGPAGMAVGGFIGGTLGYMAGSKAGETLVKTRQKVRDVVIEKSKEVGGRVREAGQIISTGVKSLSDSVKRGVTALFRR